jgi:ATPase subunit of ABC transporter with duplicated ATPase domains
VITASDLELRAGSRILLSDATLRVQAGDRIGLVGRNGAGKTTSMRVLAGEGEPYGGAVTATGPVGYLPQDPREGDLSVTANDRVLSARGLDVLLRKMEKAQTAMAELVDGDANAKAVREYGRLEERFAALGGYAAESEAARICTHLGLPERVLTQSIATLSGGQRRRVELARILFAASDGGSQSATTLLLDEPTNHLDADSITWLRSFLSAHEGGLVVISHDTELLADVVNKVWFLDATRGEVDIYNMNWRRYQEARATDEKRRRRERANAEKKAAALHTQAAKMGAKATKAVAAKNMARRADQLLAGLEPERQADRVARIRFPDPSPCGRTPLTAEGLSKSFGSLEVFTGVDLAVDRGTKVVVLGLNGAGKTTLLRLLAGTELPDSGRVVPGHGLRTGYFAQEHDTLDMDASVWENVRHASPDTPEQQLRTLLGAFMFSGDQLSQLAGTLSGGERPPARRAHQQPRSGQPRAGARRAAPVRRGGRARHARPRRGGGSSAGQGDRAPGRHRGPLVGRLSGARAIGLIGRFLPACPATRSGRPRSRRRGPSRASSGPCSPSRVTFRWRRGDVRMCGTRQ